MAEIALAHTALIDDIDAADTGGRAAFWWLGQHTFVVKAAGKQFYIDPWFAEWESRQTPTLLAPSEVPRADYVLVTHGHGDHLCPETLQGLVSASPQAQFFAPRTEAGRMREEGKIPAERLHPLNAGETWEADGVKITAIKSKHEFFDEHPELGFPYLGYVVETGGVTFYHTGDSINYEGLLTTLQRWPKIDVLFVPINGRDAEKLSRDIFGNFTFQEAAELAGELNVGLAVPSHYDMFIGNQEDPQKFVAFLRAKYPAVASWVGKAGERVWFP